MNKSTCISMIVLGISVRGWAATGVAEIKGTAENSQIRGTVNFTDTATGLQIKAKLSGLPPGSHAFHIHEFGSCADLGKAAGSHYNPLGAPHGQVLKAGIQHAHAGDLGNIIVAADGTAALEATVPDLHLADGKYNVAGRSVVVHEKLDDFSQPAGNAGGRIACGTIVLIGAPAAAAAPPPAK
jgi:superoxide dismutase, Cu-Zn family